MKTPLLIALTLGGGAALGALAVLVIDRPSAPLPHSDTAVPTLENRSQRRSAITERSSRPDAARSTPSSFSSATRNENSPSTAKAGTFPATSIASSTVETTATDLANPSPRTRSQPVSSTSGAGSSGSPVFQNFSAPAGLSSAPGGGSAPNTGGGAANTTEPEQSSEAASQAAVDLPVPVGTIAPAVYYDAEIRTPQQQAALDRIATDFEKNVSSAGSGLSQTENWQAARKLADEQYLTLFGYQAYNQYHLQAAKEAVKEVKASSAAATVIPSNSANTP